MKKLKLSFFFLSLSVASIYESVAMEENIKDTTNGTSKLHVSSDENNLSEFPLNKYGDDIKPGDYVITGKNIKNLVTSCRNAYSWRNKVHALTDPSFSVKETVGEEQIYLGFGVSITNLPDSDYKKLSDDDKFIVKDNYPKEWEIRGMLPNCNKKFIIEINQDYVPDKG